MNKQRIEYKNCYAEREGNIITFGYISWKGFDSPRLLIDLNPDEGISLNQDWLVKKQEDEQRWSNWGDFLEQIGLKQSLERRLAAPPKYVRTDEDRWEYLRQITLGRVRIYNCGKKCREELTRFLTERDKL